VQEVDAFVPCAINDLSWHRGGNAYALALEDGQVLVQDLRAPPNNGNSSSSGGAGAGSSRSGLGLTGFQGPGVCLPRTGRVHVQRRRERRLQQLEAEGAVQPPGADCYCVAFDPLHDFRLASGGADGRVKLLDMRRLDDPVEELGLHAGSVTSVAWSHSLPGLLVSAGEEGAVLLWDANKLQHVGAFGAHQQQQQQQQQQEALGLPQPPHIRRNNLSANVRQYSLPGLLFMHGGHLGAVGALALCPGRPWLVASSTGQLVEAGGVVIQRQPVQVWEVNRSRGLLC
jgi:WD40 repeat protein